MRERVEVLQLIYYGAAVMLLQTTHEDLQKKHSELETQHAEVQKKATELERDHKTVKEERDQHEKHAADLAEKVKKNGGMFLSSTRAICLLFTGKLQAFVCD